MLKGSTNEEKIWNFLIDKFNNPYGVAALMGNLYVESKLKSNDLQGSFERKFNLTDEEYTKAVDDGSYQSFVRDGAGYGLVQWTYWSRKEGLYNYAKETNASIGDLEMQLNYIWKEIQSYKTVFNAIKTATSIRSVSDIICERYEKPANQTEKGKQTRADYAQKFYNSLHKNEQKPASTYVVVTKDNVNIRAGNGTNFPRISRANTNALFEHVATAENGWYAIKLTDKVGWISGEFSKLKN